MGQRPCRPRVALAGNDGAGKTLLVHAAAHGEVPPKVATIGTAEIEVKATPVGKREKVLCVCDVGGGGRGGGLFLGAARGADALVFVVRVGDRRVYSAMWELDACVRAGGDPGIPVCVVIMDDSAPADEEEAEAGGGDGSEPVPTLPEVMALFARKAVPPPLPVAAEGEGEGHPAGGTPADTTETDAGAGTGADAARKKAAARAAKFAVKHGDPTTGVWAADYAGAVAAGQTASHGLPLGGAPLAEWHRGPWMVLPLDCVADARMAMKPFEWVAGAVKKG